MDGNVLKDLAEYKIPALIQDDVVVQRPLVVLVSRAGFSDSLREAADRDDRIRLVGLEELATKPRGTDPS